MTNRNTTRLAFASIAVCAALASLPAPASAADAAPPSAMAHGPDGKTEMNGVEGRIRHLHDQLMIKPDQEDQWHGVAQVMLDNASAIDGAVKDRLRMSHGMTAIDDLRSYEAIVDAHAEGIKKLAATFAPLYAAMPEAQQKHADAVFGRRTAPSKLKTHA